ncbi:Calcium-binding EF hand family protein [Quillaja saponaria]|uniref:Calcium-binding EF hand family protein n=1 Tax=Quillaja saponaria TaxID=32244 RepID=A0AAD7VFC1_QUISA|nr:Calcium-binding EF hand family protein [Quillaja saponaria]
MSDGALTVVDGIQLRAVDLSLPESEISLTGAQILDLADSKASSSLYGLPLPENLKASALSRIGTEDVVAFRRKEFSTEEASEKLRDYVNAIADELKGSCLQIFYVDDPLVVSVLDGHTLKLFLEDEDDFAMLAENLFTDLDTEDTGKISKNEIRNALVNMGAEMGVPPFSEFPQLNDILRKQGAEGEEELGQAQFAQLLQAVVQELAEALARKHVVFIQNIKIINGSELRKLLADEKELNSIGEKILQEKQSARDGLGNLEIIRSFLERNAKELGLPVPEANEVVVLLYDDIFAAIKEKDDAKLEKNEVGKLTKEILEKFAEQLQSNPVYHDLGY